MTRHLDAVVVGRIREHLEMKGICSQTPASAGSLGGDTQKLPGRKSDQNGYFCLGRVFGNLYFQWLYYVGDCFLYGST